MLKTDEGRRFSDDCYATKDEAKAVYNLDDISAVWEKVLNYRSFYDAETDLIDSDQSHYKICLTKKILSLSFRLQSDYLNDYLTYIALSSEAKADYALAKKIFGIKVTARFLGVRLPDTMAEKIAKGKMESIAPELFALKAYADTLSYAFSLCSLTIDDIENINKTLSGEGRESKAKYRDALPQDLSPLKAPESKDIPLHLNALLASLEDEDIPLLLRALSILYVFSYLRPFELGNEATGALAAKTFLKNHGLGIIGFCLDFESVAFAQSTAFFQRLKQTEETLDLTYFLFSILPYFQSMEKEHQATLKELQKREETVLETKSEELPKMGQEVPLLETLTYALPSFPHDVPSEQIEETASKLMEVHPHLKRKQAHFYAGHCTIGLHYTIEQFKACEHSVYETARTSMEDLAKRGFYKKEQIGKKFVYTPIPIKDGE